MFRYIQGVNKNFEEIEMTIPVVTQHDVVKEDPLGNYEDITMCFYLPHEYQPNHHEEEEDKSSEEQEDEVPDFSVDVGDEREARHAALVAPEPINDKVYLYARPSMYVFVRRFGGHALTHDSWETQMETLESKLVKDKRSSSREHTTQRGTAAPGTSRRGEMKSGWSVLNITMMIINIKLIILTFNITGRFKTKNN